MMGEGKKWFGGDVDVHLLRGRFGNEKEGAGWEAVVILTMVWWVTGRPCQV